jgi:radical SAM superfamily enzyme YgiQ (UPF0313 family)
VHRNDPVASVVLATINARYHHAAFGLRYLLANMGSLSDQTKIMEFTISQSPEEVCDALLGVNPQLIGFGVYIWNTRQTQAVILLLRARAPQIKILLGGPEVSYEPNEQTVVKLADCVVAGEADAVIEPVVRAMLEGRTVPEALKAPVPPSFSSLNLPYHLYTDTDVKQRTLYVEASRGCPFKCEFCLSSLEVPVRGPDLSLFLDEMAKLVARGARQFKFVDRTFNLKTSTSLRILNFFLDAMTPGLFVHFEVVPDRLAPEIVACVARFPPGTIQLELGVQTFNSEVAGHIQRRQNYEKLGHNMVALRTQTSAHIHADLIAGLPGETLESFVLGFNRLVALGPQEIQLGFLKRLRGTPITRHTQPFQMLYDEQAPYEVIKTSTMTREDLASLDRFAHLWDRVANSGYFVETLPMLVSEPAFESFQQYVQWFYTECDSTYELPLSRLRELTFTYLVSVQGLPAHQVADTFAREYIRLRESVPRWVKEQCRMKMPRPYSRGIKGTIPARQARHLASMQPSS